MAEFVLNSKVMQIKLFNQFPELEFHLFKHQTRDLFIT